MSRVSAGQIIGLLVVIGLTITVTLLLLRHSSSSPKPCTSNGRTCTLNTDCCSGICEKGLCRDPCHTPGQECQTSYECCIGKCENGVCCAKEGQQCENKNCCSELECINGVCKAPYLKSCQYNVDCASDLCVDERCGIVAAQLQIEGLYLVPDRKSFVVKLQSDYEEKGVWTYANNRLSYTYFDHIQWLYMVNSRLASKNKPVTVYNATGIPIDPFAVCRLHSVGDSQALISTLYNDLWVRKQGNSLQWTDSKAKATPVSIVNPNDCLVQRSPSCAQDSDCCSPFRCINNSCAPCFGSPPSKNSVCRLETHTFSHSTPKPGFSSFTANIHAPRGLLWTWSVDMNNVMYLDDRPPTTLLFFVFEDEDGANVYNIYATQQNLLFSYSPGTGFYGEYFSKADLPRTDPKYKFVIEWKDSPTKFRLYHTTKSDKTAMVSYYPDKSPVCLNCSFHSCDIGYNLHSNCTPITEWHVQTIS